jgi:hypothetical protein
MGIKGIGIGTGNPRVPLERPVPLPVGTRNPHLGYGFLAGRVAGFLTNCYIHNIYIIKNTTTNIFY